MIQQHFEDKPASKFRVVGDRVFPSLSSGATQCRRYSLSQPAWNPCESWPVVFMHAVVQEFC